MASLDATRSAPTSKTVPARRNRSPRSVSSAAPIGVDAAAVAILSPARRRLEATRNGLSASTRRPSSAAGHLELWSIFDSDLESCSSRRLHGLIEYVSLAAGGQLQGHLDRPNKCLDVEHSDESRLGQGGDRTHIFYQLGYGHGRENVQRLACRDRRALSGGNGEVLDLGKFVSRDFEAGQQAIDAICPAPVWSG